MRGITMRQGTARESAIRRFFVAVLALTLAVTTLLGNASVARAEERVCRGSIGAQSLDNIRVPDGASCTLTGTRAKGTVKVGTGSTLVAKGVRVNGNIQGEGAKSVTVNGNSTVGGSIQLKQGGSATVDQVTINGDLYFDENKGQLRATRNVVGGNLQAFKNTGGVHIANNRIDGNLQCKENSPKPTGSGNQASSKEDQCAKL